MSYEKVLKAALALTPPEKNELIGRVYQNLQDEGEAPLSPEWLAEIQRRSDEIDQGKAKLMTAAEFKRRFDKLRRSTAKKATSVKR